MLVYSVALVGGVTITGQFASRALFLSELPRSAIPFKYILPPLVLMVVSAFYAHIAGRVRRDLYDLCRWRPGISFAAGNPFRARLGPHVLALCIHRCRRQSNGLTVLDLRR
jgi:hypothetical protein